MLRDDKENTARIGLNAVASDIEDNLGWIFREQPTSDYGIDAQIEIVEEKEVTGRLVALQIKAGESYFKEAVEGGYVYRGDKEHLGYWVDHSLPVLVVLHNPKTDATHWQVVSKKTVELTEKGWKLTVPTSNVFDESSRQALLNVADIPAEQRRLASLTLSKPWMELLKSGTRVFLKAEEWVNKSSGRGSLTLFTRDDNGKDEVIQDWPFVMFPGQLYIHVLPTLFPWANLNIDTELYDQYDEELFDEQCGIWDSEDSQYILHTEDYEEWQSEMADVRPYTVSSGEVALFQLELTLNDIGNAFLALEPFLIRGTFTPPKSGRIGHDYGYGLKSLAQKYGLL